MDAQLWRSQRALTAVPDDPDGGVTLTKTRNRSEAHLVGLGSDELGQVVAHQLPLVDGPVHGDLLLPPTLQPHLDRKSKSSCVNTDSLRLTGHHPSDLKVPKALQLLDIQPFIKSDTEVTDDPTCYQRTFHTFSRLTHVKQAAAVWINVYLFRYEWPPWLPADCCWLHAWRASISGTDVCGFAIVARKKFTGASSLCGCGHPFSTTAKSISSGIKAKPPMLNATLQPVKVQRNLNVKFVFAESKRKTRRANFILEDRFEGKSSTKTHYSFCITISDFTCPFRGGVRAWD